MKGMKPIYVDTPTIPIMKNHQMATVKCPLAYLLMSSLLPACLAAADEAPTLSQHLIDLSGHRAGICSMPQCGDGKLAVELAQNSRLLVHAMSEKPAEVAAARKAADDAGLLNRTVYVEEGGVSKNPLADWCADLLVISDASDANLDQIAQKDVGRVLSPYRGVVIVGRAKALETGLTRAKLEDWLKGLDVPGGRIVADAFGLWAVATMPPLTGGDDWTHYAHGPDQNRFSKDDALEWPYLIQWTAKPYYDGKFDIAVAAGGRLFRANATLAVGGTTTDGITVRSAYSGSVLWQRKTADDFGTFSSLIVATAEVVYLKDGNGVLSATGQMAWYHGKLWLHVGDCGVFIVDPVTGKASPAIDFDKLDNRKGSSHAHMRSATWGKMRGKDIGILPGGWVVLGGKQFYLPTKFPGQPRNTSGFLRAGPNAVPLDANGYPDLVVLPQTHESDAIPVWDARETLLFGTRSQAPVLCNGLEDILSAEVASHPFDAAIAAKDYWNSGVLHSTDSELPASRQRPVLPEALKRSRFLTPLLAGNAVVFLSGGGNNWHVVAVSRTDSTMLWDVSTPAQPVFGGLSMTCGGDVLVPLYAVNPFLIAKNKK